MTMMRLFATIAFALVAFPIGRAAAQDDAISRLVYARSGSLFLQKPGETAYRLLLSGGRKRLPAFSPNGQRIAYQDVGAKATFGSINVITTNGDKAGQAIDLDRETLGGMMAVDSISWAGNETILVSGRLNPSTRETLVIDRASGKLVYNVHSYGNYVAIAPRSRRAAYVGDMPHWAGEDDKNPSLYVGGRQVRIWPDQAIEFLGAPLWSGGEDKVFTIARDRKSDSVWLFSVDAGNTSRVSAVNLTRWIGANEEVRLHSLGADVQIRGAQNTLVVDPRGMQVKAVHAAGGISPEALKESVASEFFSELENIEGFDYYCVACER